MKEEKHSGIESDSELRNIYDQWFLTLRKRWEDRKSNSAAVVKTAAKGVNNEKDRPENI